MIVIGNVTVRGCQPAQETCSGLCEACTSDICNVNIYPATRLQCHQCSGTACNNPSTARSCQNYDPNDQCYSVFTIGNNI